MLYVVQVKHSIAPTVSGTSPILVTANPAVALTAAFGAEEAGYLLLHDGDGAQVFRLEEGRVHPSESVVSGDHFSAPGTLVFARIRGRHELFVNWYDKELERTYGRVFAPLTA